MTAASKRPDGLRFLLLNVLGPPLQRLWRRLRCSTGHHRETGS